MPETLKIDRFEQHPLWGDCVFLQAETDDAEAVRSAYAEGAPHWPPLHFAVAEASPDALDPWYRLGFAQMHAYAVRDSAVEAVAVPGVELRRGGPDDLETALAIDALVYEAQAATPSYSSYVPDAGEQRQTWEETLAAADVTYAIAERGGRAIGHVTLYPDPGDDGALHLASTAVVADERGAGVGRLLTAFALGHAAESGFARVRTNWRVTNLAASRYWPARGFELTHIRLVRQVPTL